MKCKDCEHWDCDYYIADKRGYCKALNGRSDDMFGDEGCGSDSILCFGPEFGCVLFEERKLK